MEKKTQAFTSGLLAEGTGAGTIQFAAAIQYMVDGVLAVKAITDNIAFGVVGDNLVVPIGYKRQYLVGLNVSGTVSSYAGTLFKDEVVDGVTKYRGYREVKDFNGLPTRYEALSALHDYTSNFLPPVPDGICPVGVVSVAPHTAATFLAGTTDLGAANVTPTYKDIGAVPVAVNL